MATYTQIFEKNRYNLRDVAQKSRTWFDQQARLLARQQIVPQSVIKGSPERNTMRIIPGELYMFQYNAKHRETLPYWDMFPMVFPFKKLKDGFIGLNFHYLPYNMRVRLLDRLMEFQSNKTLTDFTRLKFSWATIQGVSRFKIAEPCVHRYLLTQITSPIKKIHAQDWATAMMLPVERFVGSSKQQVWKESLR
jgi:hypothetical protein